MPSRGRACRQRVSASSQVVCRAKARRLRTTSTAARVSLPWPKLFEVVAVRLEDVEGLVLDLPAGAGAVGEFDDVVAVDVEAGGGGAAVGDGAVGFGAGDLQPVDAQGVVAVANGQVGQPAVTVDAALRRASRGAAAGGRADAVEVLVEGLVAMNDENSSDCGPSPATPAEWMHGLHKPSLGS